MMGSIKIRSRSLSNGASNMALMPLDEKLKRPVRVGSLMLIPVKARIFGNLAANLAGMTPASLKRKVCITPSGPGTRTCAYWAWVRSCAKRDSSNVKCWLLTVFVALLAVWICHKVSCSVCACAVNTVVLSKNRGKSAFTVS